MHASYDEMAPAPSRMIEDFEEEDFFAETVFDWEKELEKALLYGDDESPQSSLLDSHLWPIILDCFIYTP